MFDGQELPKDTKLVAAYGSLENISVYKADEESGYAHHYRFFLRKKQARRSLSSVLYSIYCGVRVYRYHSYSNKAECRFRAIHKIRCFRLQPITTNPPAKLIPIQDTL